MCGIAGIYNFKDGFPERSNILAMTNAMRHRGPDASAVHAEDQIALGHARLAIIDLSPTANQPFKSANNRYRMVFNGELYNFREIREQIKDHQFVSSGDTEVLMEGFVRWGMDVLPKLKGMFSFAIWDTLEKELILCRDRLGVKPLYYYRDDERLVFASEIRAVLAADNIQRKISKEALDSYFSFQSINGQQSIIEGVKELKAGHYLRIKGNSIKESAYWVIGDTKNLYNGEPEVEVKKKIRNLLREAVAQRLVSDVPIGAFLSGGIDSSAVVGLMAEVSSARPETFNISFQEEAFDESPYAALIASKFNTRHHKILLKPEDMLDNLLPAFNAMDTPSGDGINSYVVSKAIRQSGITVALSGIGGDELFAGYPFFRQYKTLRKYKSIWPIIEPLRQLAALTISGESSKKERLKMLLKAKNVNIESLYPIFRQNLPNNMKNRLLNLDGYNSLTSNIFDYPSGINDLPDFSQVSAAEYLGYTQHTLLKDTDQMSMANSLEVREPFFDHELIEYVLRIPDNIKNPAYPKKLLVESLAGLLPDEIVHRKKQGFVFPWANWMRVELREFCEQRIHAISDRDFVKKRALLQEWKRFLKGDPNVRWMEIWSFIVLESWIQFNNAE